MIQPLKTAEDSLRELLVAAANAAMEAGTLPQAELPPFQIEVPADSSHGDLAANLAMVSARVFHRAPRQIAEAIQNALSLEGSLFSSCEIAGPGFMNFRLSDRWFSEVVKAVLSEKENYGKVSDGEGQKVMVEFVSANPTGPMHIGNARGGAIGDCLASVLQYAGYDVTREFYLNDAGNQIDKFAMSLEIRYLQELLGDEAPELPENAYHGADIVTHAKNYIAEYGDALLSKDSETRRKTLCDYALPKNIEGLKRDLARYGIHYDVWFYESTLHQSGAVQAAIDTLTERGMTYEKDGALWLRSTDFGAEKDDVLVRENKTPTYFAADIAYHYNKFAVRGFDKVINIWGADHHGHVARLKGAIDAIGLDGDKLTVVLMQLVRLVRGGETVRVSKRTGKSITLSDLLDEVPIDAARFFFNLREANSHFDFDLDLAVEQSSQNPVYYVQYAHARICSIFRNLESDGVTAPALTDEALAMLTAPEERALISLLAEFPKEISEAASHYDPARITRYSYDLATGFHKFYNACRVRCDDEALFSARLALCDAVRITLNNALTVLGINAPERM